MLSLPSYGRRCDFIWSLVHLDDQQSIHEPVEIVDAQLCRHELEARPVDAAHAVDEQVPRDERVVVVGDELRLLAFEDDPGLNIKPGPQFFAAAARCSLWATMASSIFPATL